MPHINPKTIPNNPITITYSLEYTEEPELLQDFENIKKVSKIDDLEDLIYTMFLLRQREKHNINIGYTITDNNNNWLIEDYANCCEGYASTAKESEQEKKINKQAETITELYNELELMKEFLTKYNAMDRFNKEMKGR
ncbi:MAG: hypothetical protein WC123_07595 [Bacilli bacterium]